jgi:hypothetical protein
MTRQLPETFTLNITSEIEGYSGSFQVPATLRPELTDLVDENIATLSKGTYTVSFKSLHYWMSDCLYTDLYYAIQGFVEEIRARV